MSVASKTKLLEKLLDKEYRDAYAEESVKTSVPFQIRSIREQRDWSQAILGKKVKMKQNAISRLESAEYGNINVNTLLRLASAFDCALLVKFVSFTRLLSEFEDVSESSLRVSPFKDDLYFLNDWAYQTNATTVADEDPNKDYSAGSTDSKDLSILTKYDRIFVTPVTPYETSWTM